MRDVRDEQDSPGPDERSEALTGEERAGARSPLRADVLRDRLLAPAGPLARLEVVPRAGSTNAELVAAVRRDPAAWPAPAVLVADHQEAGRGRAGRTWTTPPRAALTASVLLRPGVPAVRRGWAPLLVGLAAVRALRGAAGVPAALKWPNDLLLPAAAGDARDLDGWGRWRKVGGVLTEAVDDAVVAGVGVNVDQVADELPVPWATSLAVAGAPHADREGLLVALVTALGEVGERWRDADGDAAAAGLAAEVADTCATLGQDVRVDAPGGMVVEGRAESLGDDGSLLVRVTGGELHPVLAGDVGHLRTGS
ncbi:biotin--[acetyl-CoA-carboxylase] ligase [Cellulomonas marina]|nr:biotin--[acetyl-CoA-carboxylase] ligase [Cellulomonas marina]